MVISSLRLPVNFPSEIEDYSLDITQTDLSYSTHTSVSLKITTKDGETYESNIFDEFPDRISFPQHFEYVRQQILEDISNQIAEKKLKSRSAEDNVVEICNDKYPQIADTKKSRTYRKKKARE